MLRHYLISAGDGQIQIGWPASTDPGVTSYEVLRFDGSGEQEFPGITATAFTDTSVTVGTAYSYEVIAEDAYGNGSFPSAELSVTPSAVTLGSIPPQTSSAGVTFGMSATFSDGDSSTTAYTAVVDWGDGTTGTAGVIESDDIGTLVASHAYWSYGEYFGTILVSDADGQAAEPFEAIVPTFYNGGPDGFVVGQPYALTPTFSDPDGDTARSYVVTWGDGSAAQTYAGSATQFTYAYSSDADAPYDVTVLATADDGTFTDLPQIAEVGPTLSLLGSASAVEGSAYTLSDAIAGSSPGDSYEWQIDWGDGSDPQTPYGNPGSFPYAYEYPGTYTIDAIVTDDTSGQGDEQEFVVTVTEATRSASISALGDTITEGFGANFTDSFTAPSGHTLDNLTVEWGDGQEDAYYGDPGTFSHTYETAGAYDVTAIFSDDEGTYVADADVSVQVQPATLSMMAYGNGQLSLSYSDSATGETPTGYTIFWGDGSSSTYGASPNQDGFFTHYYSADGPATITVAVSTEETSFTAISDPTEADFQADGVEPAYAAWGGTYIYYAGGFWPFDDVPYVSDAGDGGALGYTITWGDGTTSTGSGPTLSHVYEFDTDHLMYQTNVDCFVYTVSQSGDSYSTTHQVFVSESGGPASLSLSGPATAVVGQPATFILTSSDMNFEGYYDIAWGDSADAGEGGVSETETDNGVQTYVLGPTSWSYTYEEPGTYVVSVNDEYDDGTYSGNGYYAPLVYETAAFATIVVGVPAQAIGVQPNSTYAIPTGDAYSLDPMDYTNTVTQWTVSWGDGQSTVVPAANIYPVNGISHVYTTAATSGTTYNITLVGTGYDGTYSCYTSVVVAEPEMNVIEGDGSVLDSADQHTNGVLLAVDDEDAGGLTDTYGNLIPDYSQTSMTTADPELQEFVLDGIPAAIGGTYSLVWGTEDFTVWADPYKDQQVTSGTTFNPTVDTTLYLEGVSISPQAAADELDLDWTGTNAYPGYERVDYLAATGIKIVGPTDVPAYSTYWYSIDGADAPDVNLNDWSATGGTVSADPTSARKNSWIDVAWSTPDKNNPNNGWYGTITWTSGSQSVTLSSVRVFSISVAPGGAGTFVSGTPTTNINPQFPGKALDAQGPLCLAIESNNPVNGWGLSWSASITVAGPMTKSGTVDNSGVTDLQIGFIQNVTTYTNQGTYDNVPPGKTGLKSNKEISGTAALDATFDNSSPWYPFPKDQNGETPQSYWKPNTANLTNTISASDRPVFVIPLDYTKDKSAEQVQKSLKILNQVTAIDTFDLSVAARTTQVQDTGVTGVNAVYTREAATSWTFDGSGTFDPQNIPAFRFAVAGISPPTAWSTNERGTQPTTTGIRTPSRLNTEVFLPY